MNRKQARNKYGNMHLNALIAARKRLKAQFKGVDAVRHRANRDLNAIKEEQAHVETFISDKNAENSPPPVPYDEQDSYDKYEDIEMLEW